jgi:hypothetical protein
MTPSNEDFPKAFYVNLHQHKSYVDSLLGSKVLDSPSCPYCAHAELTICGFLEEQLQIDAGRTPSSAKRPQP